ncbi:MAG: 4-hydroxy-tetrahydrodipicolinate reductase [Candidatus Obscuribacterales bacterium]|nr:4-hydroxy-tetrahydrodipicolinate reductase [Candidatus Obscuribacterales bacterium]
MSKKLKVAVGGINGRMGKSSAKVLLESDEFELVGAFGKKAAHYVGMDVGQLVGAASNGVLVSDSFEEILHTANKPDLVFENSVADVSISIAKEALAAGVRPVTGTSGISEEALNELAAAASKQKLGALAIPNFSIGAVLMMEFARQAGAYFSNVEIVEMHHTKKLDAPSGTAMHTVKKLASANSHYNEKEVDEHELIKGSRGGEGLAGVRVHSLRLPGLISHQEVIFGSPGELLTVRHDSFNMDCFLKGILLSLKYVCTIDELQIGLDKVLGLGQKEKECASAKK